MIEARPGRCWQRWKNCCVACERGAAPLNWPSFRKHQTMPEPMPTEPATWTVRPLSVSVPPGERRNPVAMVRLAVGPLEMTLGVSRLKKSGKSGAVVRPPICEGGTPAFSAAPEVWAVIGEAAPSARLRAILLPRSTCWASRSSGWAIGNAVSVMWTAMSENAEEAARSRGSWLPSPAVPRP